MTKAYTPSNSRLMKNTILLYSRMALLMCINLYSSRIVLQALGVEDYGIYNVVGGVIVMFSFVNDSMTASTQRFLSFELGRGDMKRLREVFATSLNIHLVISFLVILLGETIGLWFVLEKMVIPPERMSAALWCYHLSIFTAVQTVLNYPYISAIIAHEKMQPFAYIAILDAVLKLLLVYLLLVFDYDRLIFYAVLYATEKLLTRMVYILYCIRNFEECKYTFFFQKSLFKEMSSFAGWKMMGNLAYVLYSQGLNLLLNLFFGPVANAAHGAADLGRVAVYQVSTGFQAAINPQITKSYATGQSKETKKLVFRGTRITFCLLWIICLPLIVETSSVLTFWLKEVPEGSVVFLRFLLVILVIQHCYAPLVTAVAATGKIKKFEVSVSGLMLTIVPIAYVVLKLGGQPWTVFAVYLFIVVIAFAVILNIVLPMIHLSFMDYLRFAIKPCAVVSFFSLFVPLGMTLFVTPGILKSLLTIGLTGISTVIFSFLFGLDSEERNFIIDKIATLTKKN
jgi:O-antigen/teichoic acid export membrane protein